jgi:PAS domain S-box-containing protein
MSMARIPDEKADERAALRTQRLYQALLENSSDCTALVSADGRAVYYSPALTRHLGYTPAERIGRSSLELIHPEDVARAEERVCAVLAGADSQPPLRVRVRHRNGGWRVIDIATSRLVDDATAEAFVVVNARDVTDVVTATEALQDNERRLALAFEAAAMGVAEFDFVTRHITYSANFVRLLGYEPGTVPHSFEWFFSHVHAEDRAAVQSAFDAATAGDPIGEFHYRVVRRDGTVRWWAGRARILADVAGRPARAIGFVADVTDRKHLEDQMRHALKLEAIGRLAGGIAHDFNNLLTVITGYAETLVAALESDDPKLADVLEIRRAADRAAHLTQQLLAFSRKQVLRPEVIDAKEIVRDVAGMIDRLLGAQVVLKLELSDGAATITADRNQIEQVLLNLAVNARDAMPGGGELRLQTGVVDITADAAERLYPMRPDRYVLLSVCDTGVGMTPEVKARAFEPFFTTKGPGEGTGIGLATVYGTVKQSGGFVFVESEVGSGTRIDVYLPYTRAHTAEHIDSTVAHSPREASTVLLVEDYRRVRELARKVLTRQGYRVLTAPSGDDALVVAREFSGTIDVLVTDIVMPGISGTELARQLQETRPGIATVFMSGYPGETLDSIRHDGHGAGFLQKPFTPSALAHAVHEALSRRPAAARTPSS